MVGNKKSAWLLTVSNTVPLSAIQKLHALRTQRTNIRTNPHPPSQKIAVTGRKKPPDKINITGA